MSDPRIIAALIGLLGVILTILASAKATQDKMATELKTRDSLQDQKLDQLVVDIRTTNNELTERIDTQNEILNLKIEHLEETQKTMQKDIESHNHYAQMFAENVPLLKEKIDVANHRIDDLEKDVKQIRDKI